MRERSRARDFGEQPKSPNVRFFYDRECWSLTSCFIAAHRKHNFILQSGSETDESSMLRV